MLPTQHPALPFPNRRLHEEFLDEEVRLQVEDFRQKAETPATVLRDTHEELFVAFYLGHDAAGHAVLGFRAGATLPRLREHCLALLPPDALARHREWPATLTYSELAAGCRARAEVSCVWHGGSAPADNATTDLHLAGFKGFTLEMTACLVPRCIVVLGPQPPPLDYLRHLLHVVRYTPPNTPAGRLLDLPTGPATIPVDPPAPQPLAGPRLADFLLGQSQLAPVLLVQGPPGTGKTYLLAELCARLLADGKRVLVTALTNRALLELATKSHLAVWREQKKVLKLALSTDEQATTPGLLPATQLTAPAGTLVLATFHMLAVGSAALPDTVPVPPLFDYVLVDEASQALLATLALARGLGQRHLWVGDVAQLPPIVRQLSERLRVPGAVRGLATADHHAGMPSFCLTHTHRLPVRAARFTGLFYNETLISSAPASVRLLPGGLSPLLARVLHFEGGPTLVPVAMPPTKDAPPEALRLVRQLVQDLWQIDEPLEVAVLTHRRATSRALQRTLAGLPIPLGSSLVVDTVARVQGLTCDVCLYVIPAVGYAHSLDAALFNVATSRARRHTLLLADPKDLHDSRTATGPVVSFIKMLLENTRISYDKLIK